MQTANTENLGQALTTTPEQKTMFDMVNASVKELKNALPKHLSPERLARIATTCIRQNPKLALCTPVSFMGALFTAAQVGLEPVAGQAYLIPFNNNRMVNGQWTKVLEVQFVIGYKGIADLFYRHEKSGLIDWGTVHEKDQFQYEYGTNAFLKHIPATGDRGPVLGFYVVFKLSTGFSKFQYMTGKDCMDHGVKHSKTYDEKLKCFDRKSPWATNPESMCLKTVLLQCAKTMPLAIELRQALEVDETSQEWNRDIGSTINTTSWHEPEQKQIAQADTSKVAEAIGSDKKAEPAQTAPAQEPSQSQSPAPEPGLEEGQFVVSGLIASMEDSKGDKSPTKFYVTGEWLKTWDKKITAALTESYVSEKEVKLACYKQTKGRWTDTIIARVL
jgi:recombination protein RecT